MDFKKLSRVTDSFVKCTKHTIKDSEDDLQSILASFNEKVASGEKFVQSSNFTLDGRKFAIEAFLHGDNLKIFYYENPDVTDTMCGPVYKGSLEDFTGVTEEMLISAIDDTVSTGADISSVEEKLVDLLSDNGCSYEFGEEVHGQSPVYFWDGNASDVASQINARPAKNYSVKGKEVFVKYYWDYADGDISGL